MLISDPQIEYSYELMFMGFGNRDINRYPHYMYRENGDPLLVNNTEEEAEANNQGYDNITASAMSNRYLINWVWDLEDMSPKQLRVFALEEYGVDLPKEATQETLFKAVCELTRHAPQNQNRLILMAHTISMKYDATIEEIKRMVGEGALGVETDVQTYEVWA